MSSKVMQLFADVLLRSISEESVANLGTDGAEIVLIEAVTAIEITDPTHRDTVARFRGTLAEKAQLMSRQFDAYAIPAGTVLTAGVGGNGVTVAGNSAFMNVPEEVLVKENNLGTGNSAAIAAAFVKWAEKQG